MSLNTLEFTSDSGVRAVLVALCADPAIKKKALGLIAKLEPNAVHLDSTYVARNGSSLKRKTTGESICIQCGEPFYEEYNRLKECCYHSGEMEPDDEYRDRYGDDETTVEEHLEDHPTWFFWSCCERKGDEEGCRFSRHVSDPRRSKRARMSTGASDDEAGSLSSWVEEGEESGMEESGEGEEEEQY